MNVIVIVMDSLRVDHVGCYGSNVQTPNIDRVAAEGTLLEQAFAESLPTLPARTTMWTGRVGFPFRPWQPFELGDLLLAEVLWDKGYTSAVVTDVYHMHKPAYNCGRGFDTTVFVRGQEYDPWIVDERIPVNFARHRLRGDESDALCPILAQHVNRARRGGLLCTTCGQGGDRLAGAPGARGAQGQAFPVGGLFRSA
jgi:arylsulfatase A-like enzyme